MRYGFYVGLFMRYKSRNLAMHITSFYDDIYSTFYGYSWYRSTKNQHLFHEFDSDI